MERNTELLYKLVGRLQCDFADNERLEAYLLSMGFTKEEIAELMEG